MVTTSSVEFPPHDSRSGRSVVTTNRMPRQIVVVWAKMSQSLRMDLREWLDDVELAATAVRCEASSRWMMRRSRRLLLRDYCPNRLLGEEALRANDNVFI